MKATTATRAAAESRPRTVTGRAARDPSMGHDRSAWSVTPAESPAPTPGPSRDAAASHEAGTADRPSRLVLSLFPGVRLLDAAFEEEGFCVLAGPDPLFGGGDIRRFHPPAGHFWGVIGGPPCQDFSSKRRAPPSGHGLEMLAEFRRVVTEAAPEWWMLENVARVPDVRIDGYHWQRLDIDLRWFCDATRLRHVQFGSRSGRLLSIARTRPRDGAASRLPGAALANDRRTFEELCRLQGLPAGFDLPGFTVEEKKRAVGNGVPRPMGRALARAILETYERGPVTLQLTLEGGAEPVGKCACGCGRPGTRDRTYVDFNCRKRAQRRRDIAAGRERMFP